MASVKNNSSNGDSTGGFKTVAFGFDKNDVTLYIASLRKKMKQMEEEFEEKLSRALENPAASNDALKHEREVIRSEMEKTWGDKLNERNIILKQQQNRIKELEKKINENNETIVSLKTQLSAVTSDSENDSSVLSARAAKAYMQFTNELKSMSQSIETTLDHMEKTWRGEFIEEITSLEEAAAGTQPLQTSHAAAAVPAAEVQQSEAAAADQGIGTAADMKESVSEPEPAVKDVSENAANTSTENLSESVANDVPASNAENNSSPAAENVSSAAEENVPPPVEENIVRPVSEPGNEPAAKNKPEQLSRKALREEKKARKAAAKAAESEASRSAPPAPAPVPPVSAEPVKPMTPSFSFDEILEEDDDPLKGIIADLSEETSKVYEEAPAKEVKTESVAVEKEISRETDKSVSEPLQAVNADIDDMKDEFGDLLADNGIDEDLMGLMADIPAPEPAPKPAAPKSHPIPAPAKPAPKPVPQIDIDDDLNSLLADDSDKNSVKPIDNTVGETDDFADLLSEDKSYGADDDIIISVDEPKPVKGDDLNVNLLSDMVIDSNDIEANGDLGQMLEEQEKKELEMFGNLFVTDADESNAPVFPEETSSKAKADNDNPFDFSFPDSDSDDEDDMSTDASFPGIL